VLFKIALSVLYFAKHELPIAQRNEVFPKNRECKEWISIELGIVGL
jgi:hypothetical protein